MSVNDLSLKRCQIEVLSVAEGFFQSNILFALLKLKVFDFVGKEIKHLNEIAAFAGVRAERLSRLLNAGVVLKMIDSTDGAHYSIAPAYHAVLGDAENEHYLGNWVRNLELFQTALTELDKAVSGSAPPIDPFAYVGGDKYLTREYILAMHNYASLRGKELADFLDTSAVTTLLDLGAGPGTYAFNLGLRNPRLVLHLLDLPDVLEIAKEVQARYAIKNQVKYIAMDALKDAIPGASTWSSSQTCSTCSGKTHAEYSSSACSSPSTRVGRSSFRHNICKMIRWENDGPFFSILSNYAQPRKEETILSQKQKDGSSRPDFTESNFAR